VPATTLPGTVIANLSMFGPALLPERRRTHLGAPALATTLQI
jgi:hypothetical protein